MTVLAVLLLVCSWSGAQEALRSYREQSLDFQALVGEERRPYLNYRTLSDSDWDGPETLRVYGPTLFASYNSAYPHGMNDGALWQGVGLNASLDFGARYVLEGFELTFKPTLLYAQNRDFDIMPTAYSGSDGYGYHWLAGVDQPQRFGDDPLSAFDFGDSEIRYTRNGFTAGFGTQAAWIGPGRQNAIILSNNAPAFPKLDIGLRRTATKFGDVEARLFWGRLTESDYFDDDSTNDHTSISGLSASWNPALFEYLTVGFHRTLTSRWSGDSWMNTASLLNLDLNPRMGKDEKDQRGSLTLDLLFPEAGFECWVEWARNDYSPNLDYVLRYPFHSQAYTIGARKALDALAWRGYRFELAAEISNLESSRDYDFLWSYYFYGHHKVPQGYTNRGQILGAGIAGGGNSQYLALTAYRQERLLRLHVQRINWDNDYLYFQPRDASYSANAGRFKGEFTIGSEAAWRVADTAFIGVGAAYCLNFNPLYNPDGGTSTILNNFNITFSFSRSM